MPSTPTYSDPLAQHPDERRIDGIPYHKGELHAPGCVVQGQKEQEGIKHDQERIHRFDLIPTFPLYKLAEVYGIGAKKYSDNNWRGGFRWGRIFRAMIGHALAWWAGVKADPHDGQHPLASVAWCAFTLMEFERRGMGQDDRVAQVPLDGEEI